MVYILPLIWRLIVPAPFFTLLETSKRVDKEQVECQFRPLNHQITYFKAQLAVLYCPRHLRDSARFNPKGNLERRDALRHGRGSFYDRQFPHANPR